ncbi:MAG TPA: carbamoyl-phosphate synthase large subunit [Actinomycetota bacterium]|nr:carbamoyl-phosphate synthase large subunit [Actinomycetota bacterium]
MPRRTDLESVLVVGSGPIVIGQACEFDYSGTQACKVLRREGFRVVLVNSNPATIMTDPEFADATYVEPLTPESVLRVLERERPDALLPTLGGQTALNVSVALAEAGELDRLGVRLIGAGTEAIRRAEDRRLFVRTMREAGLPLPRSGFAHTVAEALAVAQGLGYPVIVRPSFVLGGGGSGLARDPEELARVARDGLATSPVGEVLVEESVAGWKEFELEVMRDGRDNAVVVCSIENVDPMGVHTGDSVTVAPALTLTDREYQEMRDAALACIRAVGVETGGSNVQFAVNPQDGRMVLIEMNPRVSRSSALASKATGFPIAKIAAMLAVGYTLDEIPNDITGETLAAFEPALDYVAVKVPRWPFEKFPDADPSLTTRMKSVGEVMAIGRTFAEALGKAYRALERDFDLGPPEPWVEGTGEGGAGAGGPGDLLAALRTPTEGRLLLVERALAAGHTVEGVAEVSGIDPWFVEQVARVAQQAARLRGARLESLTAEDLREAKRAGLSDRRIARLVGATEREVRAARRRLGVRPVFKTVDTCAGEFAARTPYHYSTYEEESEVRPGGRPRVVILGAGPNRIGQGIEFDYACVHAAFALKEAGFETVMVNSNPETVSTDYDTSDRLYFEPVTVEDVLAVCEAEGPVGVVVQLGGQTPLAMAAELEAEGVAVLGTRPADLDAAEDRERFGRLLRELGLAAAPHGVAASLPEARAVGARVGYPLLVRPSYVLGGRAMEIVYTEEELERFLASAAGASPGRPVFLDRFLEGAVEVDVDALADGREVFVGAVMEHIEEAGVHSGDSSCVIPPPTLADDLLDAVEGIVVRLARALRVRGLLNVQLAVRDDLPYVLEANPRASRTVPFVAKATGVPLAKAAARVMAGATLAELREEGLLPPEPVYRRLRHVAVKAAVLPFGRFPGVDTVLGPEMRSTGEVMGIAHDLGVALAKAQEAAGTALPEVGTVFVSVANRDKRQVVLPVRRLAELGFRVLATRGTAAVLRRAGVAVQVVPKVSEGHPNVTDLIATGQVDVVINTPFGREPRTDGYFIRTAAARAGVPCITTVPGLLAAVQGIEARRAGFPPPAPLQEYYRAAGELAGTGPGWPARGAEYDAGAVRP